MTWGAFARLRQRGAGISRNARLFLWMIFLSNVGISGVFILLYNLYLVKLGYNEDFIGLLSFVQMGAVALGAYPAGALSERFGCRRLLIAGSLVMGLGSIGQCLATQPPLLAALNFVTGVGFALRIVPYTPYLVNNTTRSERTLVFASNSAAISVAGTIGNLLGGQLPALFVLLLGLSSATSVEAYRASLVVGAVVGLAAAVPIIMATECTDYGGSSPSEPGGSMQTSRAASRSRRDVRVFILVTCLFALAAASIGPFANVYFSRVLGLEAASISVIFSAGSVLAAVATVGASGVAERVGKVRTMVAIRFAGAPLLALLALRPSVLLGTVAFLLRNVTEMAGWPLDGAFLAEVIPVRRQARTVAYRSVAWNATWAITAFAAGQVIVRFGYTPLLIVAAAVLAASSSIYYFAFSGHEKAR